jgi:hypothetical protein
MAAGSVAHAGLVVATPGVAFDHSASISDSEGGAANTSQSNFALGSSQLSRFDPTLGVLTGATLTLSSTRTQTTNTVSTDGRDNGNDNTRTSSGSGSSTAALSVGDQTVNFASVSQPDSCTGGRQQACSDGASTSSVATHTSLSLAASDAYVGTSGSVGVLASLPQLSASQAGTQFNGTESTSYQLQWAGTLGLSYEYLRHAAASFSGSGLLTMLDLDFGSVALGSSAGLGFSLFNLADPDRIGLDLDAINGSGHTDRLGTDLAAFAALGAGGAGNFMAWLDTDTAGDFYASYVLDLSDADIGAAASRFAHTLTLNLRGSVLPGSTGRDGDTRNDVPEPASLALAAAGLAGVALARRRRQA